MTALGWPRAIAGPARMLCHAKHGGSGSILMGGRVLTGSWKTVRGEWVRQGGAGAGEGASSGGRAD